MTGDRRQSRGEENKGEGKVVFVFGDMAGSKDYLWIEREYLAYTHTHTHTHTLLKANHTS